MEIKRKMIPYVNKKELFLAAGLYNLLKWKKINTCMHTKRYQVLFNTINQLQKVLNFTQSKKLKDFYVAKVLISLRQKQHK